MIYQFTSHETTFYVPEHKLSIGIYNFEHATNPYIDKMSLHWKNYQHFLHSNIAYSTWDI